METHATTSTSSQEAHNESRIAALEEIAAVRSLTTAEAEELRQARLGMLAAKRARTESPIAQRIEEQRLAVPTTFEIEAGDSTVHGLVKAEEKRQFERNLSSCVPWLELNELLSRVCWFYANNGATEQMSADEEIIRSTGVIRKALTHGDVLQCISAVNPQLTVRRVFRSYADFTRRVLLENPKLITKMFRRYNMPEHLRHVAFDFAEFCSDPPLSAMERRQVQEARSRILRGQRLQPAVGLGGDISYTNDF